MNKKEFTKNIVNNLKEKISEFKSKKEHERAERKNELDFEINKDLVNQFKKNHGASLNGPSTNINDLIKNEKQNLQQEQQQSPQVKKTPIDLNNLAFNVKGNLDSSNISIDRTKEKQNSNSKKDDILNFDFNIQNIRKSNTNTYNNYKSNNPTSKYTLNQTYSRDNSEEKTRNAKVESKKTEIMNSLFNQVEITKKNTYSSKRPYTSNITSYTSTKDKIKDFVFKLDDHKTSINRDYKVPKYNYSSNINNEKYTPSFPTRTAYVSSGYLKKQSNNDLDGFADFSINKKNDTSFSAKQRTFSSDNLNFDIGIKQSSKKISSITPAEVRALSGKIRFLSNEEIRQMDRVLIDELLSLAKVIQRTFGDNKY